MMSLEYELLLCVIVTIPVAFSFKITSNNTSPAKLEEVILIIGFDFKTVNVAELLQEE